jgi:hypothetical protein
MIIEFCKDTNKRMCAICKHNIKKREVLVKYESVLDQWKNTRMWFAHLNCLITKLTDFKRKADETIPNLKLEISRYDNIRQ